MASAAGHDFISAMVAIVAKYLLKINPFSSDSDTESVEDQVVGMLKLGEVIRLRPPC